MYYFQWQYCALLRVLPPPCQTRTVSSFGLLFGVLYGAIFAVCALFRLHMALIVPLFSLFFLVEMEIFFQKMGVLPVFWGLFGVYCSLSLNLLLRCLCALFRAQPLSLREPMFSRQVWECLPLSLGFFLAGVGFRWVRRHKKRCCRLLASVQFLGQVSFASNILIGLLLYLLLNLWFFDTADNSIMQNLWGIKAVCLGSFSLYLGLLYAFQMEKPGNCCQNPHTIQQMLLEKERQARHLSQLAFQDSLTGCYNRTTADRVLATLFETPAPFTLCFLDLDCLKLVNDTYGHNCGDRFLCDMAEMLRAEFCRDSDHVFRYGGDEFLILLHGVNLRQTNGVLCQLSAELSAREAAEGLPLPIAFSFGVADSREAHAPEELLRLADQRMYLQKRGKRTETAE